MTTQTYTFKDDITEAMATLGRKKNTVFLGENIINSGRIYGTLNKVSIKKCIEMPVAENLIAGAAIGLALAGYRPVCIFQRMDFMLIAADAIINHASLIPKMSGGTVKLPIIFRTIKASLDNKFWVGHQHSKDFTYIFKDHLTTYSIGEKSLSEPQRVYALAYDLQKPVLVVEDYNSMGKECR